MTLCSSLISTTLILLLLLVGNVSGLEVDQPQRQLQTNSNSVLVEAFLCNADFFKISDDLIVNKGDTLRICIKTHTRAKVQGITIAKMIDFFLVREFENAATMEQTLLQNGVLATPYDELICDPGSELCVLETVPMDSFFGRDGRVSAIGSVLLQHDDGSIDIYRTAMPTVASTTAPTMAPVVPPTVDAPQNNNTETTDAPSSAPQNNETTVSVVTPQSFHSRQLVLAEPKQIVETSFAVATAGNDTGFLTDFREHWDSSPTYVKVLYVFAFLFFFFILFGLGFGLLLWAGFCGNARELLLPERFQRREESNGPANKARGDDGTMDESMGALSPFARNHNNRHEGVLLEDDQYDDEPELMPKQIAFHRPSSSWRTDIEAPGPDAVSERKRQPRNPVRGKSIREGRRPMREQSLAQKARMARGRQSATKVNPNRDLAASFLQGFPKKKISSVRAKTPRSIHDRNRPIVRNHSLGEIPREKTASGVRWLREKEEQQLQQQSTHSTNSRVSQRRGPNQPLQGSTHGSVHTPRRGGVVLHGGSIPKPPATQRPSPPGPAPRPTPPRNPAPRSSPPMPPMKPAYSDFPVIPEDASVTDAESWSPSVQFDVQSPAEDCTIFPQGTKENPRPID